MTNKGSNVASLNNHRHRDTRRLLDYLNARFDAGDLHGLVVQSIDGRSNERAHMTGVYDADRAKAIGAVLALSIRMTAAQGGFQGGSY